MLGLEISIQLQSTAINWLTQHPHKFNAAIKLAFASYYQPYKINKSPVKDILIGINEGNYQPLFEFLNKKKSIFRLPKSQKKFKSADEIVLQLFKYPELTIALVKQFYLNAEQVEVSFDSASSQIQLSPSMATRAKDQNEVEVKFEPLLVHSKLLLNAMISDLLHAPKSILEQDELVVVPSQMATPSEENPISSKVILKSILRQPYSKNKVEGTIEKQLKQSMLPSIVLK